MPTYKELIAQRDALDQHIENVRQTESREALAKVKELISTYGFTAKQVFPWQPAAKKKAPAKYYDPESGSSWSGRGKPPKWIEDKDRSQYEVKVEPEYAYPQNTDPNNPFPVN